MTTPPILCTPSERDLDLLLLEEAYVSDDFLDLLLSGIKNKKLQSAPIHSAHHSHVFYNGESDLELSWKISGVGWGRLLVENKINAALQPTQAKRYQERAEQYLKSGRCAVVATLLLAPREYLASLGEQHGFDGQLSYEKIAAWFEQRIAEGRRWEFKLALLRAAIDKPTKSEDSPRDPAATAFWKSYWQVCQERFPQLGMKRPDSAGTGSSWITFSPSGLMVALHLRHKLTRGHADLELGEMGASWATARSRLRPILPCGAEVFKAGQSAAVRMLVPELNFMRPFDTQANQAEAGMAAAAALLDWYNAHRSEVIELYEVMSDAAKV